MTAEIVNLRQARKRKVRADKERTAAENRAVHGRAKVERDLSDAARQLADRRLDGERRAAPAAVDQPPDRDGT